MKYFSIAELSRSDTAKQYRIDNEPPLQAIINMTSLIDEVLDPIREKWGKPIYVNSGYRCEALNKAVGGVSTSQHCRGEASDITAGSVELNKSLFNMIYNMKTFEGFIFDQLIDESDYKWIHISYKQNNNRGEILHL